MAGTTVSLSIDPEWFAAAALSYDRTVTDGLYLKTGFLTAHQKVWGDAGKPYWPGGPRYVLPITVDTHSNLTATPTGTEALDMTVKQSLAEFVYSPAYTQAPIVISGLDRRITGGQNQILDLWKQRSDTVGSYMVRAAVQHWVAGGVAGLADANWNSINGIDRTYGFLEAAAVGSQTRTVGGLSKSTYATVAGLNNYYYAGGGSFSSTGLAGLFDVQRRLFQRAMDQSGIFLLASNNGFQFVSRAVQAQQQYVNDADDKPGNAGRLVYKYGPFQMYPEEFMPVSTTYGGSSSATTPMSFAFIDFKSLHLVFGQPVPDPDMPMPSGYFGMTKPSYIRGDLDQFAAKKQLFGQLITEGLASSAVVSGLESY